MVEDGAIGALRHVEAAYRQSWLVSKAWGDVAEPQWLWRQSTAHGSTGVLGDVGIHIMISRVWRERRHRQPAGRPRDVPKVEGHRVGDYVLGAATVCHDGPHERRRAGDGARHAIATGHANDLTLALHGTNGALKVRRWTGFATDRLSWQGHRQGQMAQGRDAALKRNARRFADALISVSAAIVLSRATDIKADRRLLKASVGMRRDGAEAITGRLMDKPPEALAPQ